MSVLYHPSKANVVADARIGFSLGRVSHMKESKKELVKDVRRLACLGVQIEDCPKCVFIVHHNSESTLVHLDQSLMELKELMLDKLNEIVGGMLY